MLYLWITPGLEPFPDAVAGVSGENLPRPWPAKALPLGCPSWLVCW